MRPTYLKITAFGPYGGTESIDMDALGQSGIYLVTGPTGAGKSTIFDAICFALYGAMSSKSRTANQFQSAHRIDDLETCIELDFEVRGASYHVVRRFKRHKTRGAEGFSFDKTAEAELVLPDGASVRGSGRVNEAIVELLGFDAEQFGKIVMLAQGDFKQFLDANSSERSKIFSKIMDTGIYGILTEGLKAESSRLSKALVEKAGEVTRSLQGASVAGTEFAESFGAELAKGVSCAEEALGILGSVIAKDAGNAEKLETMRHETNDRVSELSGLLGTARHKALAIGRLDAARAELASAREQRPALEEELARQAGRAPEREELSGNAALVQASLARYDELNEAEAALARARRAHADDVARNDGLERKLGELRTAQESHDAKIAAMQELDSAVAEEQRQLGDEEELLKNLNSLNRDCKGYIARYGEAAALRQQAAKANRLHEDLARDFAAAERLFLDSQAGILAQSLSEGEPCPVCGSTDHPRKAHEVEGAPSKEQLDELRAALDSSYGEASRLSGESGARLAELGAASANLLDLALDTLEGADAEPFSAWSREIPLDEASARSLGSLVATLVTDSEARRDALVKLLGEHRRSLERRAEVERSREELTRTIEAVAEEQSELAVSIAAGAAGIDHQRASIEQKRKELAYATKADALDALEELRQAVAAIDRDTEQARKQLEDCRLRIATAEKAIEENVQAAGDEKPADVEGMEHSLAELERRRESLDADIANLTTRIAKHEGIRDTAELMLDEYRSLLERADTVALLAKTAAGEVQGAEKVPLEIFVQRVFFEQILVLANRRLDMMTDGRYVFKRGHEGATGNSKVGLELGVIDNYTGQTRPCSTLSGGESFQASLSLALGLSDAISNLAGGRELDCMFIDEGFGSLDSDSLDLAMDTLARIGGEDKLIGIISHVDELKRRVHRQIVVEKGDSGSHVKVVAD